MIVQQILKLKSDDGVVSVPPGTTLAAVAEILAARKIGTVVVSRDAKTIEGIVSERDLVSEMARSATLSGGKVVEEVMTRAVQSCIRGETAHSVLERMTEGRFRHMPVVENGEMIGMISIGDVVKARLAELAAEKDALEGMIKGF